MFRVPGDEVLILRLDRDYITVEIRLYLHTTTWRQR